jgi:methenyltetrahydromethanopterin cyclohydrolase
MLINAQAYSICQQVLGEQDVLGIQSQQLKCGTTVIDFGVQVAGGLRAGIHLAEICMGGAAEIHLGSGDRHVFQGPFVHVTTDDPVTACMAAQYAGWPVQHGKFFAMGSGPMRTKRGREPVLESLNLTDETNLAVGVLECDKLPNDEICEAIAAECHLTPDRLTLCVAPTRSLAGCIQVVARSVETSLHKLFELGFDLRSIRSAFGCAPLPPPARDFAEGIGRTNDAILYGGHVTLWVDSTDEAIESIGAKIPSRSSNDWGVPFAELFKKYDYDFYKVDPGLFSPAEVVVVNLATGNNWCYGSLRPDVLASSFRTKAI